MDPTNHPNPNPVASPTSSFSTLTLTLTSTTTANPKSLSTTSTTTTTNDPMHTWWQSISKARSRIHTLSSILPSPSSLSSLADSDHPVQALLLSHDVYSSLSAALKSPNSGSRSDLLCQWLYETLQTSHSDLRLLVYAYVPLICGVYMSRVVYDSGAGEVSLVGFEAVLLAMYGLEVKARGGKAVVVEIADLSQPSIYHTPVREKSVGSGKVEVGIVCGVLEAQNAVKSTKRAAIVGVVLDCYFKQIACMPSWSKVEFCEYVSAWAGQHCECESEFDDSTDDEIVDGDLVVVRNGKENGNGSFAVRGTRIPLPWKLLQPVLRILGHCLLGPLNPQDVKDAASVAVRRLYARASHDLIPQGILATRSLIQLDKRARKTSNDVSMVVSASIVNTPSKAKKPEVLLVSK